MKDEGHTEKTFASLDREKGIGDTPPPPEGEFPLPAWYRSVKTVPLDKLSVEDICKACRQKIHLEHVVPIALRLLQSDPLAGEFYEGELLVSLESVPVSYWRSQPDLARILKQIAEKVRSDNSTEDDLKKDLEQLLRNLNSGESEMP
jgi:hypothetical protein